ncbi:hypothetical protein HpCK102_04830 [Helicobacter pylori]
MCDLKPNRLNKVFASFTRYIQKNEYFESLEAHFGSLIKEQRFPNNDEFKKLFITIDFYSLKKKEYFFERLEGNFDTKEPVNTQECTIEHIMPQKLTEKWKKDLGQDYERIHTQYLHTIGNLTLTGYNSEYSNRSFQEKKKYGEGLQTKPVETQSRFKRFRIFWRRRD